MIGAVAGIIALVIVSVLGTKGDVKAFSEAIKTMKEESKWHSNT